MNTPLASGRTADVYPYGDGGVLKLFHTWVSFHDIEKERRKASAAHASGIPTPSVGEVVCRDARIGLTFERVEGMSMLARLLAQTDSVESLARLTADLQLSLHRTKPPNDLPSQQEIVTARVSQCPLLSVSERHALLGSLADLQSAESFCHGDFHPGNVMLTEQGPMIIDWIDACRGNPIGDVARTSLLILGHMENDRMEPGRLAAMKLFHKTYIDRYMASRPEDWSQYRRWVPIMAAVRLKEGIKTQEDWLLKQAQAGLNHH